MALDIRDVATAATRCIQQLDTASLNVANANTPGYKAVQLSFALRPDPASGADEPGLDYAAYQRTDFSAGSILRSGGALDVALEGEGFLAVETRQGTAYIRGGSFHLNKLQELVTAAGDRVLGASGPLTINGANIQIGQDGTITVDDANVGQLKVVTFDRPQNLQKQGDGLFSDPGTAGMRVMTNPQVQGQSLEMSNVNAIREMVAMIELQRSFEAYQKIIQTMSDEDRLATTQIGKVV
jgi:flagellar basal body rod protein FlgG